jgi:hypothetical protein
VKRPRAQYQSTVAGTPSVHIGTRRLPNWTTTCRQQRAPLNRWVDSQKKQDIDLSPKDVDTR